MRILVIDDDKDICEYLEDFLGQEGHQVDTVSDPTLVEEKLRTDDFHVAVLDLMMPNISGIDLLGQIRKRDDDLAVVILTGHPSLDTATASIEHDISAYIKKPFAAEEF